MSIHQLLAQKLTASRILPAEPLAKYTTLKVGGLADYLLEIYSLADLFLVLAIAKQTKLPLSLLGGGSNVVISDQGLRGLVIRYLEENIQITHQDEHSVNLQVSGGTSWKNLLTFCLEQQFSGLELLSGIPGNVGAAPIQNIGAYGKEVSEQITRVTALDLHTHQLSTFTNEQCAFAYRQSNFKSSWANQYLIVNVEFKLSKLQQPLTLDALPYAELKTELLKMRPNTLPTNPYLTSAELTAGVLSLRAKKGMLIDKLHEDDDIYASVGSFFMNPLLSHHQLKELYQRYPALQNDARETPKTPIYQVAEQHYKIAAAWLLEQTGFKKGYIYKPECVGLSPKHALCLINLGQAGAHDILEFAKHIQQTVLEKMHIALKIEPTLLGF